MHRHWASPSTPVCLSVLGAGPHAPRFQRTSILDRLLHVVPNALYYGVNEHRVQFNSYNVGAQRGFVTQRWIGIPRSVRQRATRSYRKPSLTLDDVGCNDPLSDPEHIRVVRIDADLDPMMVGGAESL